MGLFLSAKNHPICLTAVDHFSFLVKALLTDFSLWKADFTTKDHTRTNTNRVYYLCTDIKEQFYCNFIGKAKGLLN